MRAAGGHSVTPYWIYVLEDFWKLPWKLPGTGVTQRRRSRPEVRFCLFQHVHVASGVCLLVKSRPTTQLCGTEQDGSINFTE